jgi:glycosyltransferase involved in cell wall biosynthesis
MSATDDQMADKDTDRPLVTFALIAYNQEDYIREAVEGAFSQTYEPLEIILSDDCSNDRTFEIMHEMATAYRGPHKLDIRKNEKNVGIAEHVNQIFEAANGDFITLAAGDDISLHHRVEHTVNELMKNPSSSFCECAYFPMNQSGQLYQGRKSVFPCDRKIFLEEFISDKIKGLIGASRTYRREAIEKFPPLRRNCPTEDSTLVLRCLLIAPSLYTTRPAVKRRLHDKNLSGASSMGSMALDEIWAQYREDTNEAISRGYISKSVYVEVSQWIDRTAYIRSLQQKRQNGTFSFTREVISNLTKGELADLTFTERLRLILKTALRGWFKN